MKSMEADRKLLLKQQTELRQVMMRSEQHDKAIHMFLHQHAMLHTVEMAQSATWSFADEILDDMSEDQIRHIPHNCEHSVAWCLWHMARIEDVTMNLLVAGNPQVLHQDNWLERMKMIVHDTGNTMSEADVKALSCTIELNALRAYRLAVGRRTREIVQQLQPDDLKQKVDPLRVRNVLAEGAVNDEARSIVDYWSKRNIAGLLLMPATRHNLIHLNEALKIKNRRR